MCEIVCPPFIDLYFAQIIKNFDDVIHDLPVMCSEDRRNSKRGV